MNTTTSKEPQIGDVRELIVSAQLAWECLGDCGALNMQDMDGACTECGGLIHKVWTLCDEDREICMKVAEVGA